MSLSRRDLLALLVAAGSAVAGVVVWDHGHVDIGMRLQVDDTPGHMEPVAVFVSDVTPDGNAARNGFFEYQRILDLTTTDGGDVERGDPLGVEGEIWAIQEDILPWEHLFPIGGELISIDASHRPPIEAVAPTRIATALGGEVGAGEFEGEDGFVNVSALVDRAQQESLLRQSIWIAALGLGIGVLIWRLLAHGVGGTVGREHGLLLGAAAATPFLLLPVVQAGTPIGIVAAYLVPVGLALLLGLSLARLHPERAWVQTGYAAAVVATGLACAFAVPYMSSAAITTDARGEILVLVAAIALGPAAIAATTQPMVARERARYLSFGLVPAGALTLILPSTPDAVLPVVLLALLIGWQLLPTERAFAAIGAGLGRVRAPRLDTGGAEPAVAAWRDRLTYALLGLVTFAGVTQHNSWAVIIGVGLAALVGFTVRRGFLGAGWRDAAVPLAAAVGIPVIQLAFEWYDYSSANLTVLAPVALAALGVAHLLASRHGDAGTRRRLFLAAGVLVIVTLLLSAAGFSMALLLVGLVPLVPGLPVAFAEDTGESRALSSRLETLAVALTPGAAATVLVAGTSGILLGAWLVAIVVWRQFTLRPLIGLAQRTQLQRDLAVAAAETERARLAADLHDDALQQLTMLVRTLDEAGQEEAAAEAREVAAKLRAMVGDLRLPILDDLGAGAALEWLVERVEPLAGGPVKLERSDETRPPANVELAVFRVAQEALTNAIKHGRPPIAVRYDVRADGRVTLAIDDAGEGIETDAADEAPRQGHFGLANMQQRAEQIGGLLDVRRWPAGGTRVALEWRPQ
jgi:signal transduction histidine kinase